MSSPNAPQRPRQKTFPGFEPLNSNYVYCPNQFFDVCLPNCSRGAVRIVAFLLRQTLGWLDADGNPVNQQVTVSYRDLIEKAGVSRGAIGPALEEAVDTGFLLQVEAGNAKSRGTPARSSRYELHWSTAANYEKSVADFDGIYAGEGCRSPVPNSFFDELVPNESLAVVKVVGTVLRHTVGYQAQFGGRRSSAPLAFAYIARYAQLSTGRILAGAVRDALEKGYIERLSDGIFAAKTADRQAARYRVRWLSEDETSDIGSKTPPVPEQFRKAIRIGSETPSADRSKKATKEKKLSKDTDKQQTAADFNRKQTTMKLVAEGFDQVCAEKLTATHSLECIERQIAWLDTRNPTTSRTGMLRKAIEQDWPMPESLAMKQKQSAARERDREENKQRQLEDVEVTSQKRERAARRSRLLSEWENAVAADKQRWLDTAVCCERSSTIANIIQRQNPLTEVPHVNVLNIIAQERGLPPVFRPQERHENDAKHSEL